MSDNRGWPAPGNSERLTIEGPAGTLELRVAAPARASVPQGVGVVCHPHPLHGGTMDNKVAYTLARACNEAGLVAVRFNFRGVGASAGSFDEGRGEGDDLLAVVRWAREQWPDARLALLGFSFGGYVALNNVVHTDAVQLVTVAPPLRYFAKDAVPAPACPWLVVQGDDDDVVDSSAVRERLRALAAVPRIEVLSGVGHFFHGHLIELRALVVDELRRTWQALA